MIPLRPNPLDPALLEDMRLKLRASFVTAGSGAILRRKLGQSLDYREHRPYAFGDDVRHIDWRASLRHGGKDDFLVRSFEAEEQFQLLVVMDVSATMRAGMGEAERVSKMELALWICEALGHLAIREGIRIGLVPLGGFWGQEPVVFAQGGQIDEQFARFAERLWLSDAPDAAREVLVGEQLARLKQSSVTIFITDFYRTDAAKLAFEEAVQQACRGYRQAVVCELNSWPAERALLLRDIVSLNAIGSLDGRAGAFQATAGEVAQADHAIQAQRDGYARALHLGGVVHFPWDLPESFEHDAIKTDFPQRFRHFLIRSELFGRAG
nr:DUF58 domain-containing protein [uncultured Cohaesibacter sp.]